VIKVKIAVPTNKYEGLNDTVAYTFSRAPTFTIVTLIDEQVKDVKVIENNAAEMSQGAGPLAARTLKENGVNLILSSDIGPGAVNILETIDIKFERVDPGQMVKDIIKDWVK
jgi:predicted Fe-Mo cluster-binding NifX family protein